MNRFLILIGIFFISISISATNKLSAQDPNFHIYLSFGQSNMEGQGAIEAIDRIVDSRFQVLQSVDCSNLGRQKDTWYIAVPPLTRCYSGLSPADYFGRTLVENFPDSIRVGIINVSVAGSRIELFDKDNYQSYIDSITEDWLLNIINEYDGNPLQHLIDLARLAQNDGVIKGFLLHQGESNSGDSQWPSKVKAVYDNLITELELDPEKTPLLAGEVVHADQDGIVAGMNNIIETLPQTLPNSFVISSSQCSAADDNLHFDSEGYRELGRRYALKMMEILEIQEFVNPVDSYQVFFEPECTLVGDNWNILSDSLASSGKYVTAKDGVQNRSRAPNDSSEFITIPFTVDTTGFFNVYARMNNLSSTDDSFWIKINDSEFERINELQTSGWEWKLLANQKLDKGNHTLTIGIGENGAKLDKIAISNFEELPTGIGAAAENSCTITSLERAKNIPEGFNLRQNYPNPFNPSTNISYSLPQASQVTIEAFNLLGQSVALIEESYKQAGNHITNFDASNLTSGIYIYRIKAGEFIQTRRMILAK